MPKTNTSNGFTSRVVSSSRSCRRQRRRATREPIARHLFGAHENDDQRRRRIRLMNPLFSCPFNCRTPVTHQPRCFRTHHTLAHHLEREHREDLEEFGLISIDMTASTVLLHFLDGSSYDASTNQFETRTHPAGAGGSSVSGAAGVSPFAFAAAGGGALLAIDDDESFLDLADDTEGDSVDEMDVSSEASTPRIVEVDTSSDSDIGKKSPDDSDDDSIGGLGDAFADGFHIDRLFMMDTC